MRGYRGKPVTIDGGRATLTCGVDDDGNWVALETAAGRCERVQWPSWRGGVGGMELVASTDERYLALFIYSGQSSQGFEVFALRPTLTRIGGLPELRGHGDAPVFSPGARWLATLIDCEPTLRDTGEYFEEVQDDEAEDRVVVDWARLFVLRLPEATMTTVTVGVEVPRATDIDVVQEWDTYEAFRFTEEDVLVLRMPWGEDVPVSLPPTAAITSRGFTSRT